MLLPAYKFADDFIGEVLSLINDRTIVIIVSDHGFMWNGGGYDHNPLPGRSYPHEPPPGAIIVKGKHIKPGKIEGADLLWVTSAILYAMDEPVTKDMDGKILTQIFKDSLLFKRQVKYIDSYGIGPINKNAIPSEAAEKVTIPCD